MSYNVYAVKEKLAKRINEVTRDDDNPSRAEILEAGLMHEALRSLEQLEKERDDAVDVILAVEDAIYRAKSESKHDEEWTVDRLSPLINTAKIEKALGRTTE